MSLTPHVAIWGDEFQGRCLLPAKNTDDDVWTLSFAAAPGYPAPMNCRVRRLLKVAGRVYGLKCVAVSGPPVSPRAGQRGSYPIANEEEEGCRAK